MADPTLQQVLDAIAALSAKSDSQLQSVRAEIQDVRSDVQAVRSDVAAHRAETARGFADLDAELSRHAEGPHREIERDISVLKSRVPAKKKAAPPRARRR